MSEQAEVLQEISRSAHQHMADIELHRIMMEVRIKEHERKTCLSVFMGGRAAGGAAKSGTLYRTNETGIESIRIPVLNYHLVPISGKWGWAVGSVVGGCYSQSSQVCALPKIKPAD